MLLQKAAKIYRIKDWFYQLGLVILGYLIASDFSILSPHLILSVLIGCLYLAYGYSFNLICDKNVSDWRIVDFIIFLTPATLLAIWAIYASFLPWIIAAYLANTLYSLPTIRLKRWTIAGIIINVFLFGVLFFIGAQSAPYPWTWPKNEVLILGFFFASWYIPSQLLHELSHANQDQRKYIIYWYWRRYLIATVIFTIIISFISIYIAWIFGFNPLFGWSNLIWISFLYRCFIPLVKKNLSILEAGKIRFSFRIHGLLVGVGYIIALYIS